MSLKNLKIAIVCDWLSNLGGAERVILGLHQLFPQAPIFTTVYNTEKVKGFEKATIKTSYLQKLSFARRKHQYFAYLMPGIFENFNLDEFDIVISSSHSCAKGIITSPKTLHVSYCHSPMRYAWENNQNYLNEYETSSFIKKAAPFFIHKLRMWDRLSADRVDQFVANSAYVQQRIQKYYRKNSEIIHPFIEASSFYAAKVRQPYYLAVGRLTAYKRFDLIVEAFNFLGLPLKIVGTGGQEKKLKKIAQSHIEFIGFSSETKLRKLYSEAQALIFPQVEDFGITPLEAQASGCPVIALKKGGALETIIDNKTGIFFEEQTVASLVGAVKKFQSHEWDKEKIQQHAAKFDQTIFNQKLIKLLEEKWQNF